MTIALISVYFDWLLGSLPRSLILELLYHLAGVSVAPCTCTVLVNARSKRYSAELLLMAEIL